MNTTESSSPYQYLEKMSVRDLLTNINKEDMAVPRAIEKVIPAIEKLVEAIVLKMDEEDGCFILGQVPAAD